MARQIQPSRSRVRQLRRLWPYVLMAWERWQQLSPEEKERYKKQARGYAERGKRALDERRKRRR
jgi:glycogen debranching enzyme